MRVVVIPVGAIFNRLTVIEDLGIRSHAGGRNKFSLCMCSCGNTCEVRNTYLTNGHTKSCGCLAVDRTSATNRTHGESHGSSRTTEYVIWFNMVQRCTNKNNPAYRRYGARGISICKRWLVFENFLFDMGRRPDGLTLERKNNNSGYNKSNCKWATPKEQANNRRTSRKEL